MHSHKRNLLMGIENENTMKGIDVLYIFEVKHLKSFSFGQLAFGHVLIKYWDVFSFVDIYFVSADSLFTSVYSVYTPRWTIRARVTNKSSIRNWSNSKGEGKLFSFETVDESVSRGVERPECQHMSHMAVFRFIRETRCCLMEMCRSTGRNQDHSLQQRSGQVFLSSGARQGEQIPLTHIHPQVIRASWKLEK